MYTTAANLLEALPDAEGVDTAVLERFIGRASKLIDMRVGRSFPVAGGSATERTFFGSGTSMLRIDYHEDDLLTEASVPDAFTAPTFVERRDTDAESCHLVTVDAYGRLSSRAWTAGLPVTLSAKWGYETIPGDIEDACIEAVQAAWRETYAAGLDKWKGGIGLDFELPPRAREILDLRARTQRLLASW